MRCNLCDADRFRPVWEISNPLADSPNPLLRSPPQFHIKECEACGLIQVHERDKLDEAFLEALYSADYFDSYGGQGVAYELYIKRRPHRYLARILDRHAGARGKRLLELGCAFGGFLKEAQRLGWICEGVELAEHAVTTAKANGLNVRAGDFQSLGLEHESYDAVVSLATFEHVIDPKAFITHAARLVAPGGYLMLSTIDLDGYIPRLVGRRWAQVAPPWHLFYYRQPQLVRYLETAGLKTTHVGGKLLPATYFYRVLKYRPGRKVMNCGYTVLLAYKPKPTEKT